MRKPTAIILISLAGIATCFARPGVWTALPSPTTATLYRIYVSGSEAWLNSGRNIYYSSNYPATQFSSIYACDNVLGDMFFVNQGGSKHGWAVGSSSLGARTTDTTGTAWTRMLLGGTNTYTCVAFPTTLLGFASGTDKRLHKTVDGGLNWFDAGVQLSNSNVNTLFFTDSSTGYVGTPDPRLAKTTDGGATWFDVGEITGSINDIYFCDSAHGWAVGDMDVLYYSSGSWSLLGNPSGHSLSSVFFVTASEGWTAGHGGTILHSADGGASWTAESSGTSENLYDVFFTSPTNGYAVGHQGTILRYTRTGDVEERPMKDASRMTPNATIVRGVLRLPSDISHLPSEIVLLDASGCVVLTRPLDHLTAGPLSVDVSHLPSGVYFVGEKGSRGAGVRKIVIQN